MKRILIALVGLLVVAAAAYGQDDEWVKQQQEMIAQGYGTIFDTDAYMNGDYYITEDGRIALGTDPNSYGGRPTTDEERAEIERGWNTNDAAADRIRPTTDIGLFVDQVGFREGLYQTPLKDHIQGTDFRKYPFEDDLITHVLDYQLEDHTMIRCWINRYNRIHAFRIMIDPIYLLQDYCFEDYELTEYVLKSAGLYVSEDDRAAGTAVRDHAADHLGRNFYLTRYVDEDGIDLYIDIDTIYSAIPGRDPYNLMDEVFGDRSCDPNYIGACIPIVGYDLDCSDIPVRNFFVIGTDTHRFDGDQNGVCCEPYYK